MCGDISLSVEFTSIVNLLRAFFYRKLRTSPTAESGQNIVRYGFVALWDLDMKRGDKGLDSNLTISPSSRPSSKVSRRSFVAILSGGASLAAMMVSSVALPGEAEAGPRRRRRRQRRRARRRSLWRQRHASNRSSSGGNATCFLKGTLIQTPEGEALIERIRPGDVVTTASGENRPVKWVGRMSFEKTANGDWHRGVAPIKIAKSAISEGLPSRDLYLSAAHHLYLNGLLIPATALVNNETVLRCSSMQTQRLEYYHIELDVHDVVLANGLPAETLLTADAEAFDNHEERLELYGDSPIDLIPCAPRAANDGVWENLNSHIRRMVSPLYDRRRPLDIIRDEIADRAERRCAS